MIGHQRSGILMIGALVATVAAVAACGQQHGVARLAVQLVDAPAPVDAINVTVTEVRAHVAGTGWKKVADGPISVDLLKLQNSAAALGITTLNSGTVTQIRLLVAQTGNTVVVGGVEQPLVVPSGIESGVKVIGPWELGPCTTTTVTLDFDGLHSVFAHPTGSGDEWILRPVIRTKKVERADGPCSGEPPAADLGGFGDTCTYDNECLSANCDGGKCAIGGPGVPCKAATDCASNVCGTDGLCGPGGAHGVGPCTENWECYSNSCLNGTCAPGGPDAKCDVAQDCADPFVCIGNVCTAQNQL